MIDRPPSWRRLEDELESDTLLARIARTLELSPEEVQGLWLAVGSGVLTTRADRRRAAANYLLRFNETGGRGR